MSVVVGECESICLCVGDCVCVSVCGLCVLMCLSACVSGFSVFSLCVSVWCLCVV